jgi:hypothetical protein
MSWTVSVFGGERQGLDDPAFEPTALGTGDEVRDRISAHLRGVDWSTPTWGQYSGDGFMFEFSVGPEEPITSFAVHVRGGGDAIADLLRLAVPNGWHLVDWSTGEVIDPASPSYAGWHGWQAYRDKIRQHYVAGGSAEAGIPPDPAVKNNSPE